MIKRPAPRLGLKYFKNFKAFTRIQLTQVAGAMWGGDIGYQPPQHAYNYENGQWVHADNIDHSTPKPSLVMTPAERKRNKALFSGGA
jgi:hypothetical protein